MLHFGTWPRYILNTPSPYRGWLLYQIWTKSTCSLPRYHNKHITFTKNIKYIAILARIWHIVKASTHGTCTWLLYLFFSEISQQTYMYKMYEQVAIITQIWHRVKCYISSTHGTWLLYQIWTKSTMISHGFMWII